MGVNINGFAFSLFKTRFIQFSLKGRSVRLDRACRWRKEEGQDTRFLGFEIDWRLKWDAHTEKVWRILVPINQILMY